MCYNHRCYAQTRHNHIFSKTKSGGIWITLTNEQKEQKMRELRVFIAEHKGLKGSPLVPTSCRRAQGAFGYLSLETQVLYCAETRLGYPRVRGIRRVVILCPAPPRAWAENWYKYEWHSPMNRKSRRCGSVVSRFVTRTRQGPLMPIMKAQELFGYLSSRLSVIGRLAWYPRGVRGIGVYVADLCPVPPRAPRAKNVISIGTGTACYVQGGSGRCGRGPRRA